MGSGTEVVARWRDGSSDGQAQRAVGPRRLPGGRLPTQCPDPFGPLPGHFLSALGVGQQSAQRPGESVDVPGLERDGSVPDHLDYGRYRRADHGGAAGHGLQGREPEPLIA